MPRGVCITPRYKFRLPVAALRVFFRRRHRSRQKRDEGGPAAADAPPSRTMTDGDAAPCELPEWARDILASDADTPCQTLYLQRMLLNAMELQLQATNADVAAQALLRHLEEREKDVEQADHRRHKAEAKFLTEAKAQVRAAVQHN